MLEEGLKAKDLVENQNTGADTLGEGQVAGPAISMPAERDVLGQGSGLDVARLAPLKRGSHGSTLVHAWIGKLAPRRRRGQSLEPAGLPAT
jgi:hypothetical protein